MPKRRDRSKTIFKPKHLRTQETLVINNKHYRTRFAFIENISYKEFTITFIILFFLTGFFIPKQKNEVTPFLPEEVLLLNFLVFLFIGYIFFLVFAIGFKKGLALYKPLPKNYLSGKNEQKINQALKDGKSVYISLLEPQEQLEQPSESQT